MPNACFASDNAAGVHPEVMAMLAETNRGATVAYGADSLTEHALGLFKQHFGPRAEAFFVLTGTAANVIALQSATDSFEAVICADCAHLHRDECGALEKFLGSKLLLAETHQGKVSVETVAPLLQDTTMVHRVQPKVLSIAQATEWGTVYTPGEVRSLANFCHEKGLLLHMDGARLSNAAVKLNLSLREITVDLGVDLLSFGGTKNGLLAAEAVVFFDPALTRKAAFYRKQAMHLVSKMRFVSAQFCALLSNELWRKNAWQANRMAALLAQESQAVSHQVERVMPVETNMFFARLPPLWVSRLQQDYAFVVWDTRQTVARWVTSFETTPEAVHGLVQKLREMGKEDNRQ